MKKYNVEIKYKAEKLNDRLIDEFIDIYCYFRYIKNRKNPEAFTRLSVEEFCDEMCKDFEHRLSDVIDFRLEKDNETN